MHRSSFIFVIFLGLSGAEINLQNIRCFYAGDEITFSGRNTRFLKNMGVAEGNRSRVPKQVSFGVASDFKDIDIEMEFSVPFVTIPVNKGVNTGVKLFPAEEQEDGMQERSAREVVANVNLAAIAFIGLGSLAVTGLGYAFLGLYNKKPRPSLFGGIPGNNDAAFKDASPFSHAFRHVLDAMDKGMAKFNIDGSSCAQLYVCEAVQRAQKNAIVRGGYVDSLMKILVESDWVMSQISGSSIEDAIRIGKGQGDCEAVFSKCKLDYRFLPPPYNIPSTMIPNFNS